MATNESAPVDLLRELAKDPDSNVRFWVAANLSCPQDLLDELRAQDDPFLEELDSDALLELVNADLANGLHQLIEFPGGPAAPAEPATSDTAPTTPQQDGNDPGTG